jgi:hypothetical protein
MASEAHLATVAGWYPPHHGVCPDGYRRQAKQADDRARHEQTAGKAQQAGP